MRIQSLHISNILSFKHFENINDATKITFEDGLNIVIGENGSGKSTALEVINFLFRKILYKQYAINRELYLRRGELSANERRQIITPTNNNSYSGFRLDPNWDTEDKPQKIRLTLQLDEIDIVNIENLKNNREKIRHFISTYTTHTSTTNSSRSDTYTLDVTLDKRNKNYNLRFSSGSGDFGFEYISDYNFFRESIAFYNLEHPDDPIAPLYESFCLISSYRNYHAFEKSISLRDHHPSQQLQGIRDQDYSRSLNTSDQSEPPIFRLVRLRVAEKHFGLISQKYDETECETEANKLDFITSINKRIKIVNLECKIKLIDLRTWQYAFEFYDLKRGKSISDINSLSAGQKAIVHLVFEAYGRGDLKGGVVVIDEPEIHLHYQFQHEYLQVIRELNKTQKCQYILVTHSEALISSSTINQVRRFSLNSAGNTEVKAPILSTQQKSLIRILDNTRSTYAFFAKKVLLVEGDTDRFFFKAVLQEKYPNLEQEIAVLHIGGKTNYLEWRNLFESFGLATHFIADFDFVTDRFYPAARGTPLRSQAEILSFKQTNQNWETNIDTDYAAKIYILKNGDLETYIGITKGLTQTIQFCTAALPAFLSDNANPYSVEIRKIVDLITQ